MKPRRTLTITVGWVVLVVGVLVAGAVVGLALLPAACPTSHDRWPTVTRDGVIVQPEDLDRPP